jgi:hypothetical protein
MQNERESSDSAPFIKASECSKDWEKENSKRREPIMQKGGREFK